MRRISVGKRRFRLRTLFAVLFAGVMVISLYQMWHINKIYAQEESVRLQMEQYRPNAMSAVLPELFPEKETAVPKIVNQNVADAKVLNSDIVGWLRLEGTRIDHPFVRAADNDYYLRRDINRQYSYAGTLFMDYQSDARLESFSSVIYGHNMLNGTMFSDIREYKNAQFFNDNQIGWLFLEYATYQLEVFAYMEVPSNDTLVYKSYFQNEWEMQSLLNYISQNAQRYRDFSLTPKDRLLVLSTCTNNMDDMRSVLFVRLVRME